MWLKVFTIITTPEQQKHGKERIFNQNKKINQIVILFLYIFRSYIFILESRYTRKKNPSNLLLLSLYIHSFLLESVFFFFVLFIRFVCMPFFPNQFFFVYFLSWWLLEGFHAITYTNRFLGMCLLWYDICLNVFFHSCFYAISLIHYLYSPFVVAIELMLHILNSFFIHFLIFELRTQATNTIHKQKKKRCYLYWCINNNNSIYVLDSDQIWKTTMQ